MANNLNPSGWGELIPVPKESYEDWISIEHLLHKYTIPVMAEAIDKANVQCLDTTGRRILATDGDENDIYSKAFAKKHLAIRKSIESDSAEQNDFLEERLAVEGSPLENFGWSEDNLPDFKNLTTHVTCSQSAQNSTTNNTWTQRPFEEFKREYQQAGSYQAAADIHGISRQRYEEIFKKKQKAYNFGRP